MAAKNVLLAIPLTSIDSATFTGAYQAINPTGLPEACSLVRIINDSDKSVTVSYNGTTDHDLVLDASTFQLPAQTLMQPNTMTALVKAGTVVYVKAAAGTGLVYLAGYYQPQQ